MKTKVIYRQWDDGSIIALFPELPVDQSTDNCLSYEHVGQHGAANPAHVIAGSKRVNGIPELHYELINIGYELQVMQRYTQQMAIKRNSKAKGE